GGMRRPPAGCLSPIAAAKYPEEVRSFPTGGGGFAAARAASLKFRMNRKKSDDNSRHGSHSAAKAIPSSVSTELSRLRLRLAIVATLGALSVAVAAYVWADVYSGLPAGAEATFVGRQTCAQCHQQQHSTWQGSHHDLAMDVARDMTVLGDFNNAELTHHGVTSRMFKKDGKY